MTEVLITKIYRDALNDISLFPPNDYHIHTIYEIIENNVEIPTEHFEDRPTVKFPKWKNYIHTVLPTIERIKSLKPEGRPEWHRFK